MTHEPDIYAGTGFQSSARRREALRYGPEWNYLGQHYIQLEDRLRLQVFNSVAAVEVDVTLRLMLPDGQIIPIRQQLFPTANRAINSFELDLAEGFILDLAVSTPTSGVKLGQLYCIAQIIRGTGANAIIDHVLVSQYIATGQPAAYPLTVPTQSVQGNGVLRSITGTQPAAGAEIQETVPTGARWSLLTFRASLTASAAVATRNPTLLIDDGANTLFKNGVASNQAANQTFAYGFVQSLGNNFTGGSDDQSGLPGAGVYAAGFRFRTSTVNLQAGDQWSAPQYLVMEWLEP